MVAGFRFCLRFASSADHHGALVGRTRLTLGPLVSRAAWWIHLDKESVAWSIAAGE